MPNFYLLSLGCAKNTVDSEGMAQLLKRADFTSVTDPTLADILIVNTCGFIAPARDESLNALGELAAEKRPGQKLIAAGCMAQWWGTALLEQVPGLDGILGTRRWMDIPLVVDRLLRKTSGPVVHLPKEAVTVGQDEKGVICAAVQGSSAYVKIADGCRRTCAFCAIPLIKGRAVSRPADRVVAEVEHLAAMGVKEVILIAQDSTDYGQDRGERDGLAKLLDRIVASVPTLPWIRVMYAFPGFITDRLIDTMARHPQILPYLDIPLQHAHPDVLKRMRRPSDVDWVRNTIARMRRMMPDIAIRTTFIVGFPGETEKEFQTLLDFIQEIKFDRVGAFTYWSEPGTPAAHLDPIADDVKESRLDRLMSLQQEISLASNMKQVGRTLDVLIEGHGDGVSIGRTYRDAPEIDGLAIIKRELAIGAMVPATITGAMPYDLLAEVYNNEKDTSSD